MEFGPIVTTLRSASVSKSLRFYSETLDFEVKWSWSETAGFEASGEPDLVCLECGAAVIFVSGSDGTREAWLFVELDYVELVDELEARLDKVVELEQPAQDMPWGSRELVLRDPDGHRLRFSCPLNRTRS